MPADWPHHIIRFAAALLKHQAELWLGKDAAGIAGQTLVDIGGEELQQKVDALLADRATAGKLLEAARRADAYFLKHCPDDALRQYFANLSFGDLPSVQAALADLPQAMSPEKVEAALREALARDALFLTPAQQEEGARLYTEALVRAVAPLEEFFRPLVVQMLSDLRQDLRQTRQELTEGQKMLLERLDRVLEHPQQGAPPPAVPRNLFQIPPPPPDLVERPAEMEEVRRALRDGRGAAISGLTGLGGVGKTVLGLAIARELAADFPDGQIFLDLKGTARKPEKPLTPADAMRHVLHSFEPEMDLRARSDAELQALYCRMLEGKRVLLFWDNVRSADQVRSLLPPPSCAMLLTSRWHFPLPRMKAVKVGVMKPEEAERFLRELCPRVGEHAGELARRCGYLPLALRLAGGFLSVNEDWSVPEYLARLETRRLAALRPTEGDAERDLETVFAESYEALGEEERRFWRMLAVFPAPFDRPAAAAVWGLDDDAAHDRLSLFCRYSLLDYTADGGAGRYELHDLLREFALDRRTAEEAEAAGRRHAEHFLRVLESADEFYLQGGAAVLAGLALYDREAEHIRAGWRWAAAHSPALCSAYPGAGVYVLALRLTPKDWMEWLEMALDAARQLGDRRAEGSILGNLGSAYFALGDARRAIEFHEKRLEIAREIGDRRGEGADLGNLGLAYDSTGNRARAVECMKQALAVFEAIESPYAERARRKLREWGAG